MLITSLFCLFSDINECTANSDNCDVNAVCQNTVGSHTCSCKAGYTGNGTQCRGEDDFKETQQKRLKANFNSHYFSVSTMGSKLPSSHTAEVLVLIAKTVMSASKFSIQNWEQKRAPQRAVKGQGKRDVATVSTRFSFLVQLGEAKYHLAEKITFLP